MPRPKLPIHNSCVIEARGDIRVIATLAQYMHELGASPISQPGFAKSTLIRQSLDLALQATGLDKVATATEAYQLLGELGYNLGRKGISHLRQQIVEETIQGEEAQ